MTELYDETLRQIIRAAIERVQRSPVTERVPFVAGQTHTWLKALAGEGDMFRMLIHPDSYPMMLMPWCAEQSVCRTPDQRFFEDLAYSILNGYFTVRMIDNVMDGHATVEHRFLPLLNRFYTEFQLPLFEYFAPRHPFWNEFREIWFTSAGVTIEDGSVSEVDEGHFNGVSAQKSCAAKIPLAAIAYHADSVDRLLPWYRAADLFGRWHQLYNDLFDWQKDLELNTPTYFLSEATRRGVQRAQVWQWVIDEGFEWGIDQLGGWISEMIDLARRLESKRFERYLTMREERMNDRCQKVLKGFGEASKLLAIFNS